MNDELLLTYLNDHLAGSVLGVEVGQHCRDDYADPELAAFLEGLLAEIEEDRVVLTDLIERLGGKQNVVKKSAAWLSEKATRLKMLGSAPASVAFSRMEQLELLMLGIRGKLALWTVLESLADGRLKGTDWAKLKRRAADQVERVDRHRILAAREAFCAPAASEPDHC